MEHFAMVAKPISAGHLSMTTEWLTTRAAEGTDRGIFEAEAFLTPVPGIAFTDMVWDVLDSTISP